MKFCEEKTTLQKNVIRILLNLGSMLAGLIAVVGQSWDLDWKRLGARLLLTNQTESGTKLQHR